MGLSARGRRGGVGLVLGGGGFVGGAWLIGALQGLAAELDWDPAGADCVLGTSAGAMIGSLVVGGVDPAELAAFAHGAVEVAPTGGAARPGGFEMTALQLHRALPLPVPGSLKLAVATLRNPANYSPMVRVIGWLPRGVVSTQPLKATVRGLVPSGWVQGNRLWVVACDYQTGAPTVFGRRGGPRADLADAVAASCAIPGFYHPVKIGDRCYVDGGVTSPSNLSLLRSRGLDTIICLNPTSARLKARNGGISERLAARVRQTSGRILDVEVGMVRAAGANVLVLEPTLDDVEVMGTNFMRRDNLKDVIAAARVNVTRELRAALGSRGRLAGIGRASGRGAAA